MKSKLGDPPGTENPPTGAAFEQALARHRSGDLAAASRLYRKVLEAQPLNSGALHMLGVVLGQTGKSDEALRSIEKALELAPGEAVAWSNRGNVLSQLGRYGEAAASYEKCLRLKPDYGEAELNRSIALRNLGKLDEALRALDGFISRYPGRALAHYQRARVFEELKRFEDAITECDRALAIKPDYPEAWVMRGNALRALKRPETALASYDRAIALSRGSADGFLNRGNALRDLQRFEEALASFERAIAIKPDSSEAHSNRGVVLADLGRRAAALDSYDRALALNPDNAEARCNRAYERLLQGMYDTGWADHEWRWLNPSSWAFRKETPFPSPLWLGEESVTGKSILLYGEQGFGDVIQFCRYAPQVARMGARVVLAVAAPLKELLTSLEGIDRVVAFGEDEIPQCDYACPLMSLPLAMKTTLSTIPAAMPYLACSPEKIRVWRDRLGPKCSTRVGLVWSGGFRPYRPELWEVNARRNLPLSKLAVLRNPQVEFHSLQKGQPAESELAEALRSDWQGPPIVNFTAQLESFADTAALIENLDLVIAVDTSTAHLAAALAKPVWLLNRYDTCWRWLLDRSDSPWYPTVRLYRQARPGDWDGVLERVRADLCELVAARPTASPCA